jgi:FkbM family methyltransferase
MSAVTSKLRTLWQFLPRPVRLAVSPAATDASEDGAAPSKEPALIHALSRLTRPGDYCADVGANDGRLTVVMARRCGLAGFVFAFEAEPRNVISVRQQVARCGVADRVVVEAVAVADTETPCLTAHGGQERRDLHLSFTGSESATAPPSVRPLVPAVALDRYFAPAPRLDVINIDVEGAESRVLAGACQVIERFRPAMLIEVHSLSNWRACAALSGQGYRILDLAGHPLDPQAATFPPHIVLLPQGRSF